MSDEHAGYRFSVTIQSDDLAVVGCLRALSQFCQKSGNNRIPWGGTRDADWRAAARCVTFRFSTTEYREGFLAEARRLLAAPLWTVIGQRDDDPATPQRR
jgi:hypothetical protein